MNQLRSSNKISKVKVRCLRGFSWLIAILGVATAATWIGCASVNVKKVPTPTQYVRWTDAQQKKADNMEGIRFYLPRPFLSVFESFPIRTDIYLANGLVSPDGNYVIITSVTSESGLSRYLANDPSVVRIPPTYIVDPSKLGPEGGFLGAAATAADALKALETINEIQGQFATTGVEGTRQPEPKSSTPTTNSTPQATTGIGKRRSTNDNGAFAYQPLRGNFDLVYLPDFEEQYVVSDTIGLGNAMFEVNLGQGWSLQGFQSLTDNSELNRRIFDLIDTSIEAAKSAISGLGIPGFPGKGAAGPSRIFAPEGGTLGQGDRIPGTPVTLKIVVVHYAAKGLYPVIKPRELQERSLDPGDSFGMLDIFKLFPKVQMSSNLDPTAIGRAQQAIDNQTGSYTVPRYPYQYISFNTFRYMAIEVVRPTDKETSPFEHLYDKTGTQGKVGDARVGEIDELLEWLIKVFGKKSESSDTDTGEQSSTDCSSDAVKANFDELRKALENKDTKVSLKGIDFTFAKVTPKDDCSLDVTIAVPQSAANEPIEDDELKNALLNEAKRVAVKKLGMAADKGPTDVLVTNLTDKEIQQKLRPETASAPINGLQDKYKKLADAMKATQGYTLPAPNASTRVFILDIEPKPENEFSVRVSNAHPAVQATQKVEEKALAEFLTAAMRKLAQEPAIGLTKEQADKLTLAISNFKGEVLTSFGNQ